MADLLLAWVCFPALQLALWTGCGFLVEAAAGFEARPGLVPALGFCVVVVAGTFTAAFDWSAELVTPLVALLAVGGLVLKRPRGFASMKVPALVALAAFAAYAAPVVASGDATFAGYIRLDDTATWMAFTDQVTDAGRDLSSLAPSTYEAVLKDNLPGGYPLGAFVPLGVGAAIVPSDVPWLIQPHMALLAALLAMVLWELAGGVARGWTRALVAVVAAMPALLFGYYLWGGLKEITAAVLIALAAALAGKAGADGERGAVVALGLVSAALMAVLSPAGIVWLVPILLGGAVLAIRARGWAPALRDGGLLVAVAVVLALPLAFAGGLAPPTSSPLDSDAARGNLVGPLEPAQALGIWPAGDFRLDPVAEWPTWILCAFVALLAGAGMVRAVRRREWPLALFVAGATIAAGAIVLGGSPWVDGKALATVAPAVLLAAMTAAAALARERGALGIVALALITGGVLWSNALAYRDVNLAPRDQLAELEEIADRLDGDGPVLMTEYQPYGVRHFLRASDPEAASERRRRQVALSDGSTLEKGEWADTDDFALESLLPYRALVLRRSPEQSRPPGSFELTWSGDYYDLWERALGAAAPSAHLGLGEGLLPSGEPDCADVERLAREAGATETLLAVPARPTTFVAREAMDSPAGWASADGYPIPDGAGTVAATAQVPERGEWTIWLKGSVRPHVVTTVDGEVVGELSHELNNSGLYVRLGEADLDAGRHEIAIEFSGAGLRPGAGGSGGAIGPIVLQRAGNNGAPVTLRAAKARSLCGRAWDWIEAVR